MEFLPWGKYTTEIAQPPDVVRRRLQYKMSKRWIDAFKKRSQFWGKVEEDKLKLRYMGFKEDSDFMMRNNFCPDFYGPIREENGKTILELKWRMPIIGLVFMMIWLGIAAFVAGPLFLLGYALMIWGLNTGLKDTKAAIRETIVAPGESWHEYEGYYREI